MSWGYYAGPVSDLSTDKPDVFDGARATAMMIAVDGGSFFSLRVRGIDDTSDGKKYPVHLHEGPCVAGEGGAALGHYNDDKMNNVVNWVATAKNEVWLDLEVNSEGTARSTSRVNFVPKADKRSIVIHSDAAPVPPATSPARLACLPLEIKNVR
jgi:superoxide dismutase, Cu-Zn family